MIKKILLILFPLAALILALQPNGVVMFFGNPDGEPFRSTCSYFDPLAYGYANFGPLLTAILVCILLALSLLYLVKGKSLKLLRILSIIAIITSLMPLMFGLRSFTLIGLLITLCMVAETATAFVAERDS